MAIHNNNSKANSIKNCLNIMPNLIQTLEKWQFFAKLPKRLTSCPITYNQTLEEISKYF